MGVAVESTGIDCARPDVICECGREGCMHLRSHVSVENISVESRGRSGEEEGERLHETVRHLIAS